jgi:hypothetical protein
VAGGPSFNPPTNQAGARDRKVLQDLDQEFRRGEKLRVRAEVGIAHGPVQNAGGMVLDKHLLERHRWTRHVLREGLTRHGGVANFSLRRLSFRCSPTIPWRRHSLKRAVSWIV